MSMVWQRWDEVDGLEGVMLLAGLPRKSEANQAGSPHRVADKVGPKLSTESHIVAKLISKANQADLPHRVGAKQLPPYEGLGQK